MSYAMLQIRYTIIKLTNNCAGWSSEPTCTYTLREGYVKTKTNYSAYKRTLVLHLHFIDMESLMLCASTSTDR